LQRLVEGKIFPLRLVMTLVLDYTRYIHLCRQREICLFMTPSTSAFRRLGFAFLMALPLAGCGSLFGDDESKPITVNEEPADRLYSEGLENLNKKSYGEAAKKFKEIERQHPYSEWSRKALIMSAYTNYTSGEYDQAVVAAKRFLQLYPGHTDAAYAQYLLAMSNFNAIPDITRDQARTEQALQAMEELVRRYPKSEYVQDTKDKILVARDQLAAKEMEVGRYYLGKRNYIAAVNRFKVVVNQYQTTRHVEEALMRLSEAYIAMGLSSEAQTAAAVLGHNYPDSPWYKDSYKLLSTGGLEPRENRDSWISKAFRQVIGG
jgi:outer membrane protein assembly factor BamD